MAAATQRNPKYFVNPNDFIPERWVEGFEKSLPDYAYFPFSAGPRVCIGNMFAEMEGLILLSTMLARVRFEQSPEHRIEIYASLTMRPKYGVRVRTTQQA